MTDHGDLRPILLDTNVLSWLTDARNPRPEWAAVAKDRVPVLAFVTVGEILHATRGAGWPIRRIAEVDARLRAHVVIPGTEGVARKYAELRRWFHKRQIPDRATMYDPYTMKRTQIYLDAEQRTRLARRAESAGVTSSSLIREAVASYLSDAEDEGIELARQRQALVDAFALKPIARLPDGAAFVEAARAGDRARDQELEEQWRSR